MILLQSFAAQIDLMPITQCLWQHKVPHRVRFVAGEQQLWLQNANQFSLAQELIQQLPEPGARQGSSDDRAAGRLASVAPFANAANAAQPSKVMAAIAQSKTWFGSLPITLSVVLVTLLVALVCQLGAHLGAVAWLSFFPLVLDTQAYLVNGFEHLWQQPWRLISPVFLHFSWLHLVFNLLWWLDLGARIERQSKLVLITLLLVTSLVGNFAQAWQEASLFGGLSGVIYGLLGYIWVIDRYNAPRYHLPQNILVFMLLWLLLGLSGLFAALGFGVMANLAHMGGLVAGLGWGLLHSLLWRIQPDRG